MSFDKESNIIFGTYEGDPVAIGVDADGRLLSVINDVGQLASETTLGALLSAFNGTDFGKETTLQSILSVLAGNTEAIEFGEDSQLLPATNTDLITFVTTSSSSIYGLSVSSDRECKFTLYQDQNIVARLRTTSDHTTASVRFGGGLTFDPGDTFRVEVENLSDQGNAQADATLHIGVEI